MFAKYKVANAPTRLHFNFYRQTID